MMFNLKTTPYTLDAPGEAAVRERLEEIESRVALLRSVGTLTSETLQNYYGQRRFEEVAQSNALEGSTLSVGETQLAVMRGVTLTGHDPAYVRDAIALNKALDRISVLATDRETPTDIEQLRAVHELVLGGRPSAGMFRREEVIISGSLHRPPRDWAGVMSGMESWQTWSKENAFLPAPIRAAVLHAWLTHVHPYLDGNGRTARAIGNLELIRAGYPSIIIKKTERDLYIDSLAESDIGGDISAFLELILRKVDGSLRGLELAANAKQGYDAVAQKVRVRQQRLLQIWETSVKLLASSVELHLSQSLESVGGKCSIRLYDTPLDLEDYLEVCDGRPVSQSWAFEVRVEVPGLPRVEHLAWIGYRTELLKARLGGGGPSLFWSHRNSEAYPKWKADGNRSPFAVEITSDVGKGDAWIVRRCDGNLEQLSLVELSQKVAGALVDEVLQD
jgi:Fic family protein